MSNLFCEIEEKWLSIFEKEKAFQTKIDPKKKPYYCLEMFPYPSGTIHMGHVRNYAIGDVMARYKRMSGYQVLHPIGWDAFGLPAENAALQHKVAPAEWTQKNIDAMRKQLHRLGFAYDWTQEINTSAVDYYRWGQWFFIKFYEKGLVYRKNAPVNWDPVDKTVLANEQVINGKGWRSGVSIVRKSLPQWFFRITHYAEELYEDLQKLEGHWPSAVLTMQRNWIGKSEGFQVHFNSFHTNLEGLDVFTSRVDTLYGVTFLAIAFDHKDVRSYVTEDKKGLLASFVQEAKRVDQHSAYEKKGMDTGICMMHPLTKEKIPLYVVNYVLGEYGTGVVMGVPAHDERDFEFARSYGISMKVVVQPTDQELLREDTMQEAYLGEGTLMCSGEFDGLSNTEGLRSIASVLEETKAGQKKTHYRLKDWLISRQRYWGNPIPVVYAKDNLETPVVLPVDALPINLPEDVDFSKGEDNPLTRHAAFKDLIHEGKAYVRETETMDTFTCSSWYFMRYMDPHHTEAPFSQAAANYWKKVNFYIGGVEHACMHLLYARFFCKAMRDLGLTDIDEPFQNLLTQGMVCNASYYTQDIMGKKTYYTKEALHFEKDRSGKVIDATLKQDGRRVFIGPVEKMSKSKNNGVSPHAVIERYGADAVRLFVLFAAPPEKDLEWNVQGLEGCYRFLKKIWRWHEVFGTIMKSADTYPKNPLGESMFFLRRLFHKTIKKVTDDIGRETQFNTAIAALMEFSNHATTCMPKTQEEVLFYKEMFYGFLRMLSVFAPLLPEEMAMRLGYKTRLYADSWPTYNEVFLEEDTISIVVQVNGKVRGKLTVASVSLPTDAKLCAEKLLEQAMTVPNVHKWIENKNILKKIYIPKKLINVVVS